MHCSAGYPFDSVMSMVLGTILLVSTEVPCEKRPLVRTVDSITEDSILVPFAFQTGLSQRNTESSTRYKLILQHKLRTTISSLERTP